MKYLLQIYPHQGPEDWARLSTDEQDALVAEYLEVSRSPGVVDGAQLQGDRLRVEHRLGWGTLHIRALVDVFDALEGVARLCERRAVQVKLKGDVQVRRRFAWSGGEAETRCPFCRDAVQVEGDDAAACAACDTLHHAACLAEAGGCTVFGCAGGAQPRRSPRAVAG